MAFIGTKKIKGNEYAYIVENKWKSRGKRVRQKSKKYLGRVYRFSRADSREFFEFCGITDAGKYIREKAKEEIVHDLVKVELFNHGFEEREKGIFSKEGCFINLRKNEICNSKKNPIAVAFNEGLLTGYALRKILNFRADAEEEGYDFAKMFVEAGLNVPKEIFVGLFSKVYK